MIHDAAIPPRLVPPVTADMERAGVLYRTARWSPGELERLITHLAGPGQESLLGISDQALLAAWGDTVEAFLDPGSNERRRIDPALARLCGLSPEGLTAGLQAVLGGVRREPAEELLRQAGSVVDAGPVLVILASNLPALAVQPLLPALALRRPVLLKSPSAEPLFAPAFLATLGEREPALADGLAAVTWRGGDEALEAPLLGGAGSVLAYGEAEALADLEGRAPGKLVPYGPKTSLAALGPEVLPEGVATGLARDIALFDQRGCLSIQAIYTAGDPRALADALAEALDLLAGSWPPGPVDPVVAAGVQQVRIEAEMRGLYQRRLALDAGTLIVEPEGRFQPSPGLRTVRIHPLEELEGLPSSLQPWSGRLQGAALAGEEAWTLRERLEELGISRFAEPGELQTPDALWHNGGVHPLAALGGP